MLTIQLYTIVLPTLIQLTIFKLQITANKHFTWFDSNHMKANPEKSHLLLSSKTSKKVYFGVAFVKPSTTKKFLGIQIDSDLTFDEHISSICNKVAKKINVLSRLVNYVPLDKRCMVNNAFIESQFNYCFLIWMFHSKTLNIVLWIICLKSIRPSLIILENETFFKLEIPVP